MKTNAKPIIMTTLMMFMIFFMNVQEGTAQTQEVHQAGGRCDATTTWWDVWLDGIHE